MKIQSSYDDLFFVYLEKSRRSNYDKLSVQRYFKMNFISSTIAVAESLKMLILKSLLLSMQTLKHKAY